MQLVLIDPDDQTADLAVAVSLIRDCQVTAYVHGSEGRRLDELGAKICPFADWPDGLNLSGKTAFLVGGTHTDAEILKVLAQSASVAVVRHPACDMVCGFQLQMIQRDSGAQFQPFFAGVDHGLFNVLRHWCAPTSASPIGRVRQMLMFRSMDSSQRRDVLTAYSQDALLLRRAMERIDRVNGIGINSLNQADWSGLSVEMSNDIGLVSRWTQVMARAGQASRIEILGDAGSAIATLAGEPTNWTLSVTSPESAPISVTPREPNEIIAQRLVNACVHQDRQAIEEMQRDWDHAVRTLELVDAVEQSCLRGKTIQLFNEEVSEEATFKGVMAAGGCFILLALLAMLISIQAISTVRPEIQQWWGWTSMWRLLLLGILGFLSLQLLQIVFRSAVRRGNREDSR